MSGLKIDRYEVVENFFAIKWSDGSESYIDLKRLREKCPCANCAGERDVFGNVYLAERRVIHELGSQLNSVKTVGHYALQFFWKDGHDTGIYRFEFLKSLGDNS